MPRRTSLVIKSRQTRSASRSAGPAQATQAMRDTTGHSGYSHLTVSQREWQLLVDPCTLRVGPKYAQCVCRLFILLDPRQEYYTYPYTKHKKTCRSLKKMELTDDQRCKMPDIPPGIYQELRSNEKAQPILNPLRERKEYVKMGAGRKPVVLRKHPALQVPTTDSSTLTITLPPKPRLTLPSAPSVPSAPSTSSAPLASSAPPSSALSVSWNGSLAQQIYSKLLQTEPRVYEGWDGSLAQQVPACNDFADITTVRSACTFPESYERSSARATDFHSEERFHSNYQPPLTLRNTFPASLDAEVDDDDAESLGYSSSSGESYPMFTLRPAQW